MDVAVVGAGRVGTALAVLWARAGHAIVAVSGREGTRERAVRFLPGVPVREPAEAAWRAQVTDIATPDGAIAEVVAELVSAGSIEPGQVVAHVSGAQGLAVLADAQGAGGRILAMHPVQSFPTVEAGIERLPGSAMAVTARAEDAFAVGEELARDAGATPFRLADEARPLYHAAAVFAANYLATTMVVAERLMRAAGVEDPLAVFAPLSRAVLENVVVLGPEAALTGPAARGEAETIGRNLEALARTRPEAVAPYVALARVALDVAEEAGRLSAELRRGVEEVLAGWS